MTAGGEPTTTTTSAPSAAPGGRLRRPSTVAQADEILFIASKLDQFAAHAWWASPSLIATRLLLTAGMALIPSPTLQAAAVTLISIGAAGVQLKTVPYRRTSE